MINTRHVHLTRDPRRLQLSQSCPRPQFSRWVKSLHKRTQRYVHLLADGHSSGNCWGRTAVRTTTINLKKMSVRNPQTLSCTTYFPDGYHSRPSDANIYSRRAPTYTQEPNGRISAWKVFLAHPAANPHVGMMTAPCPRPLGTRSKSHICPPASCHRRHTRFYSLSTEVGL